MLWREALKSIHGIDLRAQRVRPKAGESGNKREFVDREYSDGRWLRVSKHIAENNGVVGYGIEITDLKHRELHLIDNELRYNALTQISPVGVWQLTAEGETRFVNTALIELFDLDEKTFYSKENLLKTIRLVLRREGSQPQT